MLRFPNTDILAMELDLMDVELIHTLVLELEEM